MGMQYKMHIDSHEYDRKKINQLSLVFAIIGSIFAVVSIFLNNFLGLFFSYGYGTMFGMIIVNAMYLKENNL